MKNKDIAKNFLFNTAYQILVLLAPLITTPYITRTLGATNIGIYQYSQSIATYFMLIGAVGTSLYGQREIAYLQKDKESRSNAFWEIEIFRLSAVLLGVLIYGLAFCIKGQYDFVHRILIVEVLATAIDISWLFMGMENFKITVIRNGIIKLTGIICIFLFVKTENDLPIYTICVTFPALLGNFSLWLSLRKYVSWNKRHIGEIWKGIIRRIKPILVLFLPQIAADVYLVLDKTMIGILATDVEQVAFYSEAQKLVKLVLTIVTSLGVVMLPAMSSAFANGDQERIRKSIKTAFRFIFMLSFSLLFGLCAVAPRFIPIFLGEGFDPVVPLMIVISPILIIIAISNVLGKQYLLPTKQQKIFTISIICGAGVNFVLNWVLIPRYNAIGASIATVIAELTVALVQCIYVRKQLPIGQYLISGIRYCLFGVVMFFAVRGIATLLPAGKIWALLLTMAFGVLVYVVELFITRDEMINYALQMVINRRKK